MNFEIYLKEQLRKHPVMQPQDVIKMCYQAAYGAEHLLADPDGARDYFEAEYAETAPVNDVLYEKISDTVCRVNLPAWKVKGLPAEWLFRMFAASCKTEQNTREQLLKYLHSAEKTFVSENIGFTMQEWKQYLIEYEKMGMLAVHHSEQYRNSEHPAYRIVNSYFCKIFPILERAKEYWNGEKPCVIAIDGRAASGKTTLANYLQIALDADIIHMDDFFVPLELRSEERFQIPGANIHYERFADEVLPFVSKKKPFAYRIFNCGKMDYDGKREIGNKQFCIVEGSYSCHPFFGEYADITVFSNVSAEEQIERIRSRNGEEMLKVFLSKWIPMEEEYFSHYRIEANSDIGI